MVHYTLRFGLSLSLSILTSVSLNAQTVTRLDPPTSSYESLGYAISPNGTQVAGQVGTASGYRAYLWTGSSWIGTNLGTLGSSSIAYGVNNSPKVVGSTSVTNEICQQGFSWTSSGGMTSLGAITTVARSISPNGSYIAGIRHGSLPPSTSPCIGASRGFRNSDNLLPLANVTLYPISESQAFGVNDSGIAVGVSQIDPDPDQGVGYFHATQWSGTTPTDLGTLGGDNSYAYAINGLGRVVGAAQNSSQSLRGFFKTSSGTMTELPPLTGGTSSCAYAVNSSGDAVGYSVSSGGVKRAVWWKYNGTSYDAPQQLLADGSSNNAWSYLTEARGISDRDANGKVAITGYGTYRFSSPIDTKTRTFVWKN